MTPPQGAHVATRLSTKTQLGSVGRTLAEQLAALKTAIWKRRPILGELMAAHGQRILHDYAQDFFVVHPTTRLAARQPELIATVQCLLAPRLGSDIAEGVAQQLRIYPLVSTTDHHGTIDHPFFVNANLVSALPTASVTTDVRYLPVLSFASVSVNNASAFPRGILFHGGVNGSGNFIRLPILPDKLKMGVVYGTRAFTRADLDRALSQLTQKEAAGEIIAGRGKAVRAILEEVFGHADVLRAPDFAAQVTVVNHKLWPKLFPSAQGSPKIPDLVYLEIESLVADLLQQVHLTSAESPLAKLLFDPAWRAAALRHFDSIPGAFSAAGGWGTYLFWAVDGKGHRVRLGVEGGELRSTDGLVSVPLTPDCVAAALREKRMFPSMLLCYLAVALYYGFKCLGGFCQVHDLTLTKAAWVCMLRELGEMAEAEAAEAVETTTLGGDGLVLAHLKTPRGVLVPATGIDLAIQDIDREFADYVALSRRVTLAELMDAMLPEMYSVLYAIDQRDPELAALTPEDILQGTGLQAKLEAGA